jgi:hypothetical protein
MESVKANTFEELFRLQKELLTHYIPLENLPQYPVDLNSRPGQRLLKDFASRFIEELAEAHESLSNAQLAIESNEKKEAMEYLAQFNKELADSHHFLMELLIYSGYGDWEAISGLISRFIGNKAPKWRGLENEERPLKTILSIGNNINFSLGNRTTVVSKPELFSIVSMDEALKNPQYKAGRNISRDAIAVHSQLLWDVTSMVMLTVNHLKNRDWSSTEREVNMVKFEENLASTLIYLGVYLDYIGAAETSIVMNFRDTTRKNLKRIKDGY